jgi:hypothetical protein
MAEQDNPVVPTPDELATNNTTPVDPSESYTPISFIFAPEARSMGGEIDEQPVQVESETE